MVKDIFVGVLCDSVDIVDIAQGLHCQTYPVHMGCHWLPFPNKLTVCDDILQGGLQS